MSKPHLVHFNVEKVCRSCRRNRRGAAAVEFAVVAPVLFLMVFGMIEYGRAVMVQQVMTNAAREGARSAVLDGATATDVETRVVDYLTGGGISSATADHVTIDPSDPASAGYGDPVTVTVSIPFNQVSWLGTPMYLNNRSLTATAVMRRETVE
jgi:Flp pilus assembly pilin Flp